MAITLMVMGVIPTVKWSEALLVRKVIGGGLMYALKHVVMGTTLSTWSVMMATMITLMGATLTVKLRKAGIAHMVMVHVKMIVGSSHQLSSITLCQMTMP